eukprot:5046244-Pyramimonas_sp.AAC.2
MKIHQNEDEDDPKFRVTDKELKARTGMLFLSPSSFPCIPFPILIIMSLSSLPPSPWAPRPRGSALRPPPS